uniref:Uncharacterized protein n=1 Tax=Quercus lobata TaxID=97700 RepID=A0A7N2N6L5_QUELO
MGGEVAGSNIDGFVSNLENKRIDLFDRGTKGCGEDNVLLAPLKLVWVATLVVVFDVMCITDEVTVDGCYLLVQTVQDTINVGTETAAALKDQVVNELDSIHFSIKKASQLVKELGRQVATDKCIMALLFLIVIGVIAIIIVKLVNPNNKDIRDIPGLAPPAMTRKLLWSAS